MIHRLVRPHFSLALMFLCLLAPACDRTTRGWEAALAEEIARGPGTIVELDALTRFRWERFYVFGPYTRAAEIEEVLGFRWRGARRSGIESSEGINLLVFVADERVVASSAFPRDRGDFYRAATPRGYSPEEARFVVDRRGRLAGGQPHLVLTPLSQPGASPSGSH